MNFVDFQKYIGTLATKYSDFEFNIRIYDLDNSEKQESEGFLSSDKYIDFDENLLKSLEQGLPESSGMALGVDRLIMWLCGVQNIRDVICFSEDEI